METEQALAIRPSLSKERLLRILGVTFGVAVGIGGTIGIGILRVPGSVAAHLGNSGLIMAVLIFFTAFHWLGLRAGSRAQEIMSLFKVLAFFVIIAACFLFSPKVNAGPSAKPPLFSDPKLLFVAIALSMQSILGTYAGWHAPVYFSEENTDPAKSIPRSLFSGVTVVMAIYVLIN